jgi:acyl carrier protein
MNRMKSIHSVARGILASHTGRSDRQIRAWHRLERDLDMTPLELVLVMLEVEQLARVELPAAGLENVETVGDLFAFLSYALAHGGRAGVALARVA